MNNSKLLKMLGKNLAEVRLEQDLSQEEVAKKAGIGQSTITRLENGKGCSMDNLINVLRALNRLDMLEQLISEPEVSPLAIRAMSKKAQRLAGGIKTFKSRASGSRTHKGDAHFTVKARLADNEKAHTKEEISTGRKWNWGDES